MLIPSSSHKRNAVPSVLGPILLILYANDILYLAPVGVTIKLSADDNKFYTVFSVIR